MTDRSVADLTTELTASTPPEALAATPAVASGLAQFRPEPHSVPSFFMWTLGCQDQI